MQYILNKSLAELIGIIIGDGCVCKYKNQYLVEIVGHPLDDLKYFVYIQNKISELLNKKVNYKQRGRGLRLRIYSKNFVSFLINRLGFPYGKGKSLIVQIPRKIISNKDLAISCLRGIVDTDGSFFFCKKSHTLRYPVIEVGTCSENLAFQISSLLEKNGFKFGLRKVGYFFKWQKTDLEMD